MAAGRLPAPGTEYGPCRTGEGCEHRDCIETRQMAACTCRICFKEIAYETRFYVESETGERPFRIVHADCAEREVENEREARTA